MYETIEVFVVNNASNVTWVFLLLGVLAIALSVLTRNVMKAGAVVLATPVALTLDLIGTNHFLRTYVSRELGSDYSYDGKRIFKRTGSLSVSLTCEASLPECVEQIKSNKAPDNSKPRFSDHGMYRTIYS